MKLFLFGDSHKHAIANAGIELGVDVLHHTSYPYTMARYGMEGIHLINMNSLFKQQHTYLQYGGWANMLNDTNGWQTQSVQEDDIMVYSFGEIDCRAHMCSENNFIHYKDMIDQMVIRYFDAIATNKNSVVLVNCIVPPMEVPLDKIKDKRTPQDPTPFVGSNENRKSVILYLNQKLKEYCEKNKYIFLDVYDKYTDKNGFMKKEKSDSFGNHIIDFSEISLFLKNFIPINNKAFKQKYQINYNPETEITTLIGDVNTWPPN